MEGEEVCRVCRSTENTPDHPLFYPCKCSGSMKYVHQDCLEEWLAHSRKKHCEICNHQFAFTPIYSEQAPEQITIRFFIIFLLRKLISYSKFYFRILLSVCVWLLWVPYVTVWVWRIWFDPTLLLSNIFLPSNSSMVGLSSLLGDWTSNNGTAFAFNSTAFSELEEESWISDVNWHGALQAFFADVFEGQIITSIAIIVGLALTGFKDYVVMNTPVDANGNFIDANDPIPPAQPIPQPQARPPARNPRNVVIPRRNIGAQNVQGRPLHNRFNSPINNNNNPNNNRPRWSEQEFQQLIQGYQQMDPQRRREIADRLAALAAQRARTQPPLPADPLLQGSVPPSPLVNPFSPTPSHLDSPRPSNADGIDEDWPQQGTHGNSQNLLRDEESLWPQQSTPGISLYTSTDSPAGESSNRQFQDGFVVSGSASSVGGPSSPNRDFAASFEPEMAQEEQLHSSLKGKEPSEPQFKYTDFVEGLDSDNDDIKPEPGPSMGQGLEELDDLYISLDAVNNQIPRQDPQPDISGIDDGTGNEGEGMEDYHPFLPEQDPPPPVEVEQFDIPQREREPWQNPAPPPPAEPQVPFNFNVQVEVGPDGVAAELQAQGDVNAFLELVGIHGPIDGLLHNAALAILVIVVVIGAGVWAPYITGRFMLWLVQDIYMPAMNTLISSVTSLLQAFTDPVLDPIVDGLVGLVKALGLFGPIANSTALAIANASNITTNASIIIEQSLNDSTTINLTDVPQAVVDEISDQPIVDDSIALISNQTIENLPQDGNGTENSQSPPAKDNVKGEKVSFPEKVTCILIGYLTHGFIFYHHARRTGRLKHPYAKTLGRIFSEWFSYIGVAIKFTFFVVLELGMFPTFCGILIDLCTLPVFGPSASIGARWRFFNSFPWISWFLHWLSGTVFMFQLAIYISTVRKIVRPGVVWFVRDPDDPNFHPMQDIVRKPTLTQLRKLAFGALTYAMLVIGNVGGVVAVIKLTELVLNATGGPSKFWPIKWEFTEPLSEFPIDLLIFHFFVPWVVTWIRPRQLFRKLLGLWFRFIARRLRLTSFLFGTRMIDEESEPEDNPPIEFTLHAPPLDGTNETPGALDARVPMVDVNGRLRREFRYLRVPNRDHIEVIPKQKVMIPMRSGEPVMGRANETMDEVKANWTRVYVPDQFRLRLIIMLVCQWLCGVFFFSILIMTPLVLGRVFFIQIYDYLQVLDPHLAKQSNSTMSAPGLPNLNSSSPAINASNPTTSLVLNYMLVRQEPIRPDLPVHDLFSFSVGMVFVLCLYAMFLWVQKITISPRTLNQIHQFFLSRREPIPSDNVVENLFEQSSKATAGDQQTRSKSYFHSLATLAGLVFGTIRTGALTVFSGVVWGFKALFVAFWIGFVIPTLLSLLVQVYVVLPMIVVRQTHVVFLLQHWALGAMYTKILYLLILAGPDTEFRQTVNTARVQLRDHGFNGLHLKPLALKVVMPTMLVVITLLVTPLAARQLVDQMFTSKELHPDVTDKAGWLRYILPAILIALMLFETCRSVPRVLKRWMDQVRDEHFLVGRKLHNAGDVRQLHKGTNEDYM